MANCPACKEVVSGPPIEAATPPYHFLKCGGCDLVFTDPMPSVDGDWYKRQEMYIVRDTVGTPQLSWNHRQFFKDLPANGGKLLDVGCGTGAFLAAAGAAGYDIAGFDFDPEAVRFAQERLDLKQVFTGDLRQLKQAGRFDVVTAFEVLEHSPSPAEFAASLAEVVRQGGYAAISVPNRERWPNFRYGWDLPPNHLTRWSRAALTRLLEKNGFEIVRTATGWRQGEIFLSEHLQFGLITRLVRRGKESGPSAVTVASGAYKLKTAMIRCLALPLNAGLGLIGETGMTLYILAKRK